MDGTKSVEDLRKMGKEDLRVMFNDLRIINMRKQKESNIIPMRELTDRERIGGVYRKDNGARLCSHEQKEVDNDERTVKCLECGKFLDAFDVLYDIAGEYTTHEKRIERWEKESKKVGQEYEELKKKVRNAKRALSNARKKLKQIEQNSKEN